MSSNAFAESERQYNARQDSIDEARRIAEESMRGSMRVTPTPGQWRAEAWSRPPFCGAITVLVDDPTAIVRKRVVAECETEADAQLIAASKELLAAAQLARKALSELLATNDPLVYSDALRALDAAIAKAGAV